MLMRRRRIMWMHSFAMTFMECHRIIRGISNIASLVRTRLQQWDNMQKRIFLYRCIGSNFFFAWDNHRLYTCLAEYKTASSYPVIFVFARCSAKTIFVLFFFQNVTRANNYIYLKQKRNILKKKYERFTCRLLHFNITMQISRDITTEVKILADEKHR